MYYRGAFVEDSFGHGAWLQAQVYGGDHGRYALGYQFGSYLGCELGFAYRAPSPTRSFTAGPHLGAFLSVGFVSIGVRSVVPLLYDASADKPPHYGEIGAFMTLKWPIGFGNISPMHVHLGRWGGDVREE
jgi:hypothetical protein